MTAPKQRRKRQRAESKESKPTVVAPYEIPGLPIAEGPVSLPHALTTEKKEQPVVVTIPPGAFQYVWEMLEAKGRADHQKYGSVPTVLAAVEQSVGAFRRAAIEHRHRNSRRIIRLPRSTGE